MTSLLICYKTIGMLGAISTTNASDTGTKPNGSAVSTTKETPKNQNEETASSNKQNQNHVINNPITKSVDGKDDTAINRNPTNGNELINILNL